MVQMCIKVPVPVIRLQYVKQKEIIGNSYCGICS